MMSNPGPGWIRAGCLTLLVLLGLLPSVLAADTNTNAVTNQAAEDAARFYAQVQEQLRGALATIETNRQQTEAAAATNARATEARLRELEKTFADGRLELLEAMNRSDRMVLWAAGTFAAIGFLVLLLAAFLQWTSVNRLAAAAASLSAHAPQIQALGPAHLPPAQFLEQSSTRFLALIERLEQRIHELESSVKIPPSLSDGRSSNGDSNGSGEPGTSGEISSPLAPGQVSTVSLLLSKSQTLLKLDKAEAALACLEEILAEEPGNTDALVKKGSALERLQRYDEAIQCYDRAIAQDNSMTMAYLYKGGVFNRTERYSEALACYEQALKGLGKPPPPKE